MTVNDRLMILERRAARHDKEMDGIRKLIAIGMKLLNYNQEQIRLLGRDLRSLAAAQRRTEEALRGFIESRRGSNGHSKRKIDLQ